MRRFLSLFLVLLLALRGLAGDAMAMEQNAAQAHHMDHAIVQAQDLSQMAAMAVDSPHGHTAMVADAQLHGHHDLGQGHKAAPSGPVFCSAETAHSDCHQHEGHCTACGICHSTLATPELLSPHSSAHRALLLAHGTARFASAAPFELVKPPISAL